jgi:hypothetical protein
MSKKEARKHFSIVYGVTANNKQKDKKEKEEEEEEEENPKHFSSSKSQKPESEIPRAQRSLNNYAL